MLKVPSSSYSLRKELASAPSRINQKRDISLRWRKIRFPTKRRRRKRAGIGRNQIVETPSRAMAIDQTAERKRERETPTVTWPSSVTTSHSKGSVVYPRRWRHRYAPIIPKDESRTWWKENVGRGGETVSWSR